MKNVRGKKRIVGLLVVMMMIFTMVPGMAFAAGGNGGGSGVEVKIKINDGGTDFSVNVGEKLALNPTVTNAEEGTYHIHWTKTDGKKYFKFVKNNGEELTDDTVSANSINVLGVQKTADGPDADPADIKVEVIEGKDHKNCTGTVMAEKAITLTVIGTESADPYAYAAQGKDVSKQSVLLVKPSDITQLYPNAEGQSNSLFINEISGKLDSTNKIQFVFKMGKGMGGAYDEAAFVENGIKNIAIYDAGESTVIASYEKGNLKFLGRDNETDRNLTIELDADTLDADTKYILLFGEDMAVKAGADKLGADVKFNFATKKVKTEDPTNPTDPTDPIEPTDPTVPGEGDQDDGNGNADESDKATQTGDDSNMLPMFALMIAALLTAGATLIRRREN